ncbi:unnamed protein product [Schistosoma curassoni]|uniref:ANK_REP_REGION domain-containing protein n=1 Tax=Schistosoma curassoni TaxID=6186 RepID=A0A183KK66_9TREM|nr:unnamed protein product [Schistosoma curassoni]
MAADHLDLQADLDDLVRWAREWGLEINARKSALMHIGHGNSYRYTIEGKPLPCVQEHKDLGVVLSHDLKTTTHCKAAAVKGFCATRGDLILTFRIFNYDLCVDMSYFFTPSGTNNLQGHSKKVSKPRSNELKVSPSHVSGMDSKPGYDSDDEFFDCQSEACFYAVASPLSKGQGEVFVDPKRAYLKLRGITGARLKLFANHVDANKFANTPVDEENLSNPYPPSPKADVESSPYPSASQQTLIRFRSMLDSGNVDVVKQMVDENPMILVTTSDTPTILQNFETPLHFASKYGHIECVSMLARHPLTKLDPRNFAGHTPVDLAATRLTSQEKIPHSDFDCPTNIVNRILQIFDERYN